MSALTGPVPSNLPPDLQAAADWTWWLLYDMLWKIILPAVIPVFFGMFSAFFTVGAPFILGKLFTWKLRMFRAGAVAHKKKLVDMDFFAVDNPQKYCCEGVVGSHQEQTKIVDEAFSTILIFLGVCLIHVLISTAFRFTDSWIFTIMLVAQSLVLNYIFVQLLNVSWARNLKLKDEKLVRIDRDMQVLQNGGIFQLGELGTGRNRRNRQQADVLIDFDKMDPKQKDAMRKSQLESLMHKRNTRLQHYPIGFTENESSTPLYFSAYIPHLILVAAFLHVSSAITSGLIEKYFGVVTFMTRAAQSTPAASTAP